MGDKVKRLVFRVLELANVPFFLVRLLFVVLVCMLPINRAYMSANLTEEQARRFCAAFDMTVYYSGIIGTVLFVLEYKWYDVCFDEKVDELVSLVWGTKK